MSRRNIEPPDELETSGYGHVLLGGVPYRVAVMPDDGLKAEYAKLWLTEDVGRDGEFTANVATTWFAAGTILIGRHIGEHGVTGLPLYELARRDEDIMVESE